jgi:hypothetical protein
MLQDGSLHDVLPSPLTPRSLLVARFKRFRASDKNSERRWNESGKDNKTLGDCVAAGDSSAMQKLINHTSSACFLPSARSRALIGRQIKAEASLNVPYNLLNPF